MNAAVIIETRNYARIPEIVEDHLKYLPGFELVVYCSKNNIKHFDQFNCQKYFVNVNNLSDYNRLMTSLNFWDKLKKFNRVLIFQTDSRILREGIDEFLGYSYIGAPWKFQDHGGNGGVSVRNPKTMIEIIKKTPYNPFLGFEDVYFSNHIKEGLAPREVCRKFSCETIFEMGTFAYHAIETHLNHEQVEKIKNQYS